MSNYLKESERTPLYRLNYIIHANTKKEICPYCVSKMMQNYETIYMCGLRTGMEKLCDCTLREEIIFNHRGPKGGSEYLDIISPCFLRDWAKCPFNPNQEKN